MTGSQGIANSISGPSSGSDCKASDAAFDAAFDVFVAAVVEVATLVLDGEVVDASAVIVVLLRTPEEEEAATLVDIVAVVSVEAAAKEEDEEGPLADVEVEESCPPLKGIACLVLDFVELELVAPFCMAGFCEVTITLESSALATAELDPVLNCDDDSPACSSSSSSSAAARFVIRRLFVAASRTSTCATAATLAFLTVASLSAIAADAIPGGANKCGEKHKFLISIPFKKKKKKQ